MSIPARVSLITLGVADVEASTAFYQAVGWPLSSSSVPGEVSFFKNAGAILALWSADNLRADAGLPPGSASGRASFRDVALAINCADRAEVDAVFVAVEAAGGSIVTQPHATDWGGYSGYFADPDGHLFEVAHNPGWPLDHDGLPILP